MLPGMEGVGTLCGAAAIRLNLEYLMSVPRPGSGLTLGMFPPCLFFFSSLLISAERLADTSLPMMPCEPTSCEGLAPKVPLTYFPVNKLVTYFKRKKKRLELKTEKFGRAAATATC